jgi:hypothetical protein
MGSNFTAVTLDTIKGKIEHNITCMLEKKSNMRIIN